MKPPPNQAFNRTRRYGRSFSCWPVTAGRLTWSCWASQAAQRHYVTGSCWAL